MGQIVIRNLDDAVLAVLRRRAAAAGRSMEEEVRRTLAAAAGVDREAAAGKLAAVRQRIGSRRDVPAEQLLRRERAARTRRLAK